MLRGNIRGNRVNSRDLCYVSIIMLFVALSQFSPARMLSFIGVDPSTFIFAVFLRYFGFWRMSFIYTFHQAYNWIWLVDSWNASIGSLVLWMNQMLIELENPYRFDLGIMSWTLALSLYAFRFVNLLGTHWILSRIGFFRRFNF